MAAVTQCPVCSLPVTDTWVLLSSKARGDDPVETRICPACTLAMTGEVWTSTDPGAGYRARAATGPAASLYTESDDGSIVAPNAAAHRQRLKARVLLLRQCMQSRGNTAGARVLDVGCKDGLFLTTAAQLLPIEVIGLEPWQPWRRHSASKVPTRAAPIERWVPESSDDATRYDIITDFDILGHMPDPVAHLQAIAGRLREDGLAIVETTNLLGAAGKLDADILRTETPWTFTPRALATACRRAGLMPIQIHAGCAITVVCRKGVSSEQPVEGPDALKVAHLAWGNDLRLSAKRTLARNGATPRVIRGVSRIHKRCPIPDVRADLAIEIANALERCADYNQAASWLRMSLQDRHDPQVLALVEQLHEVQSRMNHAMTSPLAAPVEADEPAPLRLAS